MRIVQGLIAALFAGDFSRISAVKMALSSMTLKDFAVLGHLYALCERFVRLELRHNGFGKKCGECKESADIRQDT